MQLERKQTTEGEWIFVGEGYGLRTHEESNDCHDNGCVLHNPSVDHRINVEGWPYNWRTDRGIMERICIHGVGHPDPDSANFLTRHDKSYENVHGCCGCCSNYGEESVIRNPRHAR